MSKDYSWGLVLSGGAAWGIANGGVLSVFEEHGIEPDYVGGSSMGAIIAALYCAGHRTETFSELLDEIKSLKLASMSEKPLEGGLHGGLFRQNITTFLEPRLQDKTIEDCDIPLVIVAGRILAPIKWQRIVRDDFLDDIEASVEPIVFPKETKLIDAILASSAIPILFSPYEINGTEYIDLANFGAIPAKATKNRFHPQRVIAVDTAPRHLGIRKFLPKNWQRFLDAGNAKVEAERDECALILEPVLPASYYRFDKAKEIYEAGRAETKKHLPDVLEVIHGTTP